MTNKCYVNMTSMYVHKRIYVPIAEEEFFFPGSALRKQNLVLQFR